MLSRRRSAPASRTTSRPSTMTVPRSGVSSVARIESAGRTVNGFVVNHDGRYRAYVNRCPHVGTPLDLWPNEFFSEDGRALICSTHGAIYEPTSGLCTAGPCVGDRLTALPLVLDGETLVVRLPAATVSPASDE